MVKQVLYCLSVFILALIFAADLRTAQAAPDPWGYAGKVKGVTKDGGTTWTLKMTLKPNTLAYKLRGTLIGKNKKAKHVYSISGFFDPTSKILGGTAKKKYSIVKGVKHKTRKKKQVTFDGGALGIGYLVQFHRKGGKLLGVSCDYTGSDPKPTPTPTPVPGNYGVYAVTCTYSYSNLFVGTDIQLEDKSYGSFNNCGNSTSKITSDRYSSIASASSLASAQQALCDGITGKGSFSGEKYYEWGSSSRYWGGDSTVQTAMSTSCGEKR